MRADETCNTGCYRFSGFVTASVSISGNTSDSVQLLQRKQPCRSTNTSASSAGSTRKRSRSSPMRRSPSARTAEGCWSALSPPQPSPSRAAAGSRMATVARAPRRRVGARVKAIQAHRLHRPPRPPVHRAKRAHPPQHLARHQRPHQRHLLRPVQPHRPAPTKNNADS